MESQSDDRIQKIVINAATAPTSATVNKAVDINVQASAPPPDGELQKTVKIRTDARTRSSESFTQKFWKKNWWLLFPYAAITLATPFSNLIPSFTGWFGVGVGEAINIFTTGLGLYAVTRFVRETRAN